jgi:hypothetical protein
VSTDQWADENGNPMFDRTAASERTRSVGTDNTTGHTVAMVSLTTGNPADPAGIVTASTWLIGDAGTAEAFRSAMTERYGKPVKSAQPADLAGTGDGLVIFGEGEAP